MTVPASAFRPSLPRLALVLSLLLVASAPMGCARRPPAREEGSLPFVFRSLNLRQQDLLGRPAWELTSPEARYDLSRRVAQALRPRGVIYAGGKPLYRLSAQSGTVLNDGEVILLEGAIRLEKLGPQAVLIRASRVRWIPQKELMEIDRHPEAFDAQGRLLAQRARFRLDKNRLELRGSPQLQRWSRPFDPLAPNPRGRPELVVFVREMDWKPSTGLLETRGPVRAARHPEGSAPKRPPQTLTAARLEGNTLAQDYTLMGPVQLRDPAEALSFEGSDLRVQAKQNQLSSARPFLARRGAATARGDSLLVRGGENSVEIPSSCWLEQPGESLQARRCRWNWTTQQIEAEGHLEIRRSASGQFIRGHLLQGRLGDQGQLKVTNPGGRVVSRFQVPKRKGPAPTPAPPRRGPEPIRL